MLKHLNSTDWFRCRKMHFEPKLLIRIQFFHWFGDCNIFKLEMSNEMEKFRRKRNGLCENENAKSKGLRTELINHTGRSWEIVNSKVKRKIWFFLTRETELIARFKNELERLVRGWFGLRFQIWHINVNLLNRCEMNWKTCVTFVLITMPKY